MNVRRVVELEWYPLHEGRVSLPDSARVVQIDFHDEGGLGNRRTPHGVWVEVVVERYDADRPGRDIYSRARPTERNPDGRLRDPTN